MTLSIAADSRTTFVCSGYVHVCVFANKETRYKRENIAYNVIHDLGLNIQE